MIETAKETFMKILSIVEYKGDREDFYKRFMNNCYSKALLELSRVAPEGKRDEILRMLNIIDSSEDMLLLLRETFGEGKFETVLAQIIRKEIEDYVKRLIPVLTEEQKVGLQSLSEDICCEFLDTVGIEE
ncbi:hypothetical protein JW710_03755 [Candidatus Dojkabacteria bacterium]|nr:hypothetical protein [Candidatus Dojkabacteria bacterium]